MSTSPGADELRIRGMLRQRGVGPSAPPPIPPKPTARPRDWLDEILVSPPAPATPPRKPAPAPVAAAPASEAEPVEKAKGEPKAKAKASGKKTKRKKRPGPNTPRSAFDSRPASPRQSLLDAWDRIPYRLKWLGYHASAAYLGWSFGLVGYATFVAAWIADTGFGPQAIFWCCVGAATVLLHHRTRGWWWPIAWLAAVPASSVVVGVLLYGTPHL